MESPSSAPGSQPKLAPPTRRSRASFYPQDDASSMGDAERTYRFTFTGSARAYFRIWIINAFLTVVTLGIYNAWAKVRSRRYFYAHTTLDGYPFDYVANPFAILKGNMIVGAGLLQVLLAQTFIPELSAAVAVLIYLALPYLIYVSLRFRTQNSVYRNIRFHFHGSLGESYWIYLGLPLLIPLTLGLIVPYLTYRQKKYVYRHLAYGQTQARFYGTPWSFYPPYLVMVAMSSGVALASLGLSGAISSFWEASDGLSPLGVSMLVASAYALFAVAAAATQQYLYAQFTNYAWHQSILGPVRFSSTLRTWPLIWLRLTNVLAIIGSLGLLIPWARVRRARYMLDHLRLIVRGDLNHFIAIDQAHAVHAIGDTSVDFFNVDVGL